LLSFIYKYLCGTVEKDAYTSFMGRLFSAFLLAPAVCLLSNAPALADAYHVNLTMKEMRIDHMATHSRCPLTQRSCTLSLSIAQPVGSNLFSSRLDIPLLSSERMTSAWNSASVGDYVLHLSNTPLRGPDLRLVATTRF
jgi:hypothetical protein